MILLMGKFIWCLVLCPIQQFCDISSILGPVSQMRVLMCTDLVTCPRSHTHSWWSSNLNQLKFQTKAKAKALMCTLRSIQSHVPCYLLDISIQKSPGAANLTHPSLTNCPSQPLIPGVGIGVVQSISILLGLLIRNHQDADSCMALSSSKPHFPFVFFSIPSILL